MRKYQFALILFLFILIPGIALSANYYVRAGATGSNNGSNWTNAWHDFDHIAWASLSAGDTVWVAGGTYKQWLAPTKGGTSDAARISIRRARSDATECTGATGWNASYDSEVHQDSVAITFSTSNVNYVTISGRTTASGGGMGWYIDFSNVLDGHAIEINSNSSYITFEYIQMHGAGHVTYTPGGQGSRGIDDHYGNGSHHTYSHMEIEGFESLVYILGTSYATFEYVDFHDAGALNVWDFHPDVIYVDSVNNAIVRYCRFHANDGEGIFFTPANSSSNWTIYGNIFYHLKAPYGSAGYSKAVELQTGVITGLKIFNNVFDDNWANIVTTEGTCGTGCQTRNNIFIGTGGTNTCGTSSNNLAATVDPFVNRSASDYHIIGTVGANYPRNAGINLSSYFTTDADGNGFGADGAWDVGAFEYGSDTTPPASVKNLRIVQ